MSALRDNPEVIWGFLAALVIVVLLAPAVGGMARRLGAVDEPEARRLNQLPVPRLGGIALFFGIFVPALAFLEIEDEARGILLGAAAATIVGAVDDARGLVWWQKLAGQGAAAGIPTMFGIWIDRFTFPYLADPALELSAWIGVPATIAWIVAIMNMVNFLDGLDGLAAGVCGIAGGTFALIALSLGKVDAAIVSAIVFGACVGFLRHNFYPARIFMGDSGALLLGFILSAVAIQGLLKTAATVALFFPLLVLAVPIIDTSFVIARRLKHREKLYVGDQAHLHHRFLRRGFTQRRAALIMYGWCGALALAPLVLSFFPPRPRGDWQLWPAALFVATALVALAYSLYIVYLLELVKLTTPRTRRRLEREEAERRTA